MIASILPDVSVFQHKVAELSAVYLNIGLIKRASYMNNTLFIINNSIYSNAYKKNHCQMVLRIRHNQIFIENLTVQQYYVTHAASPSLKKYRLSTVLFSVQCGKLSDFNHISCRRIKFAKIGYKSTMLNEEQ